MKKQLLFGLYIFFEASHKAASIESKNCSIRHVTAENISYLSVWNTVAKFTENYDRVRKVE